MPARFFDVVVLGMRIGALATAALLARRDFRVLVLGHGALRATYRYDGLPLRRRAFAHLAATSPAWRRVVAELAQSQVFRRRLRALDPMLQVLEPRRRLELAPDPALFTQELERALPGARQQVEELYARLAHVNARADEVFEKDVIWPPETFWERRETNRLRALLPFASSPSIPTSPDDLSIPLEYLRVAEIPARFSSHVASSRLDPLPALALARLHGAWTRGLFELPGDEDEVSAFLVERIRAHGGDVRPEERCEAIVHTRGRPSAVVLEGDGEVNGCAFVIGDRPAASLVDLVRDAELAPDHRWVGARVAQRRFTVSLVVRRALVPKPLARHAFLVPSGGAGPDALDVHLHRATFSQAAMGGTDPALAELDAELWVAEAILDDPRPVAPGDPRPRQAVLATIREHFPFLDRHALVIDSPHDGGPLHDARGGSPRLVERVAMRASGGHVDPEVSEALFRDEPDGYAGLAGEPLRTPIANMLTVSPSVLPHLGAEGELIAAWSAARIVTRSDRKKEKMRRDMWSKIEM